MMTADALQALCESGSVALQRMDYLSAEAAFVLAEVGALELRDFDTLSRLYFPLQEARRQRRQVCGEGTVRLDLLAAGPDDDLDPEAIAVRYPHGQLLVAGWKSVSQAVRLREIYADRKVYAETFLAAVMPVMGGEVVAVLPFPADLSQVPEGLPIDELVRRLPAQSVVLTPGELPKGEQLGSTETFARTMAIWERLHLPWLSAAQSMPESEAKLSAFRRVTEIDYACERAHQDAARTARELARRQRGG